MRGCSFRFVTRRRYITSTSRRSTLVYNSLGCMKKMIFYIFFLIFISSIFFATYVHAVDCEPTFNRDYTVERDCDWPGNYKVYWDIIVWNKTVNVPNGRTMWIDLSSNKVTFSTWKVLIYWTWKINNSASSRYYITKYYSASSGVTNCPSWYEVLNTTPSNYQWNSVTNIPSSGVFYCWK